MNKNKKLKKDEAKALKDTKKGKSYSISDFSFKLKTAPSYHKHLKEVEIAFKYKNEVILYHYYVDTKLKQKDAIDLAKKKINEMIKTNKIAKYAKKYYKRVY